jgi:hypothetical protein
VSIPNIEVSVYPVGPSTTERQLQLLELAPASSAFDPVCVLPLQLWIQNKQSTTLHLNKIEMEFADPALNTTIMTSADFPPGQGAGWFATKDQYIFLPSPPPSGLNLKLFFTSFDPWSDAVTLVPFPTSFHFPGKAADLGKDEFWLGKGAKHAGGGDQIFHYDLGMIGWDPDQERWTNIFPGTDGSLNEHHRIWGRPVYALADGVVTFYENSVNANSKPGTVSAEGNAKGWGNAFNIQHGPYIGTYMHMQKGSLNPALIQGYPEGEHFLNGAIVKAGDFLGLAGNAGTSSAPHLHVGLVISDPGRWNFSIPLPFSDVYVIEDSDLVAGEEGNAPWAQTNLQGLAFIPDDALNGVVAFGPYLKSPKPAFIYEAAIDPIALVLGAHSPLYVRLTLPDPPPIEVLVEQIREQVKGMREAERRRALERVKGLNESLQVLARELDR